MLLTRVMTASEPWIIDEPDLLIFITGDHLRAALLRQAAGRYGPGSPSSPEGSVKTTSLGSSLVWHMNTSQILVYQAIRDWSAISSFFLNEIKHFLFVEVRILSEQSYAAEQLQLVQGEMFISIYRCWSKQGGYQATGLHITMEEADAWLAKLEAGQDVEPPECHA